MTNINAPFGFQSFGRLEGGAPTAGMERFFIFSSDANSYFRGDPVAQSSGATLAGVLQPYFGSSVSPIPLGIFQGCEFFSPTVGRVVWSNAYVAGSGAASSSPVTAYVITDPDEKFIVQASSAAIGSSRIGVNVGMLNNTSSLGNTTTGISAVTVDSGTPLLVGSSFPFRIIDVYSNYAPPGANGTDNANNFNIVVVTGSNWSRWSTVAVST
jgi:hypothetical protein